MTRAKAAAVLDALEQGAPDVPTAYGQAAQATGAPVEEVAAESQSETIRAACRLRAYGLPLGQAVAEMAALTLAPGAAISALVSQRWSGQRSDARQRYRRIGVVCPLAAAATCNAALAAAWAEPLSDPRGGGRPSHSLHAQCLADNATLLGRPLYLDGEIVGYGLRMQATPGDVARMKLAAEGAGAIFLEPGATDEDTVAAYDAAVAALGWTTVGPAEEET